jgi:hypothetical protein
MHTVSESISLPLSGFFSPFPHGTCSLSVNKEYLALEDGPPTFNQGFSCPGLLFSVNLLLRFNYGAITLYGSTSQSILLHNNTIQHLGSSNFARHYFQNLG